MEKRGSFLIRLFVKAIAFSVGVILPVQSIFVGRIVRFLPWRQAMSIFMLFGRKLRPTNAVLFFTLRCRKTI